MKFKDWILPVVTIVVTLAGFTWSLISGIDAKIDAIDRRLIVIETQIGIYHTTPLHDTDLPHGG